MYSKISHDVSDILFEQIFENPGKAFKAQGATQGNDYLSREKHKKMKHNNKNIHTKIRIY